MSGTDHAPQRLGDIEVGFSAHEASDLVDEIASVLGATCLDTKHHPTPQLHKLSITLTLSLPPWRGNR